MLATRGRGVGGVALTRRRGQGSPVNWASSQPRGGRGAEALVRARSDNNVVVDELVAAAKTKEAEPARVVKMMRSLRGEGVPGSVPLDAISGSWDLVFSNAPPLEALYYIPVDEIAVYDKERSTTELTTAAGPFRLSFQGTFEYDERKSEMTFSYGTFEVSVPILQKAFQLGPWVFEREAKRRVYQFYYADEDIACAYSQAAGAETLLRRI
ncbi:hypothetical protein HOP50_08g52360 [Chloropicon primus]|uniref:Plastid lipid-associated protein/fibrillin conserved domain-containing protein n=1 Tax=Chloropicon primus TaxID=1764295 RepID=A0A5B8MPT9_9CHLO|nr:hypothetical protein A3770_08p52060 [Chloropicon primus]UPR01912.1 hypothetical protein HOP50_08g52360 [Chloropicon primus]|eukprot:QDZ22688.1 hypothetical protein A3770_08p52060 [Chloropicon primus]